MENKNHNMVNSKSLKSPLVVQFEVTHACNNDCIFCHNDLRRADWITLDTAKKVLDNLNENGVFQVIFTGGEPLLHPELLEMMSYAKKLDMEVGLITNGVLLEEIAEDLVNLALKNIQVSILGYDISTHDALVKHPGSFIKAAKGISKLKNLGYTNINVNATLTKDNIMTVDKILQTAHQLGANSFTVTRYIPVNKNDDVMMPSIEEINWAIKQLLNPSNPIQTRWINALPYCAIDESVDRKDLMRLLSGCDGGLTWATITPTGEVVPCPCWQHNCGNLLDNSLKEIWKTSSFLNNLRDGNYYPNECRDCMYYTMCRGGCRGCALSWTEDLAGNDPYFKQVVNK